MRIGIIVIAVTLFAILAYSISDLRADSAAPGAASHWYGYQTGVLEQRVKNLCTAIEQHAPAEKLQQAFLQARLAYKPMELLITYYLPYTDRFINGPNLLEVEPDEKDVMIQPEGFQVLEALLFPSLSFSDTAVLLQEAQRLHASLNRLQLKAGSLQFTDAQLFDAMRQELLRVSSLGLSGFDSPAAQYSLPEAAAALHGVETVWHFYTTRLQLINPGLAQHTQELLTKAQQVLHAAPDFNTLDRLHFISNYMNRLMVNLKLAREALDIPYPELPHFLDPAASNAFARDAFDPTFYAPNQAHAGYIRSLVKLNSPFDAFMRGDTTLLDNAAKRGFNIFMGKAKCGTCHFMPLFNGVAPPDFAKAEAEIIGVPRAKDQAEIDADDGKYNVHKIPLYRYAFKTPTLRNVALTAPYMHNGVFDSLEEVMVFYNNGGGAGMGIQLKGQTLPADSLHLSEQEQQDVIAFMQSLTDTTTVQ